MSIQEKALSGSGERVDELYLLHQQAQGRLEKSHQQQISFTKGCDTLFEQLERKIRRMETATNKSHRVAKQLEVDVLLSQRACGAKFSVFYDCNNAGCALSILCVGSSALLRDAKIARC